MHALNLMIARQMVADIERIGDTVEISVVPPLCPVDVSPYDFTRAGELIDRAGRSTREWLDEGGLARRGVPHQLGACPSINRVMRLAKMRWDARRTAKHVAGPTCEPAAKADRAFCPNPSGTGRLGRLLCRSGRRFAAQRSLCSR